MFPLAFALPRVWSWHKHIEDGEKFYFSAFDAEAEHVFDSLAVFALIDIYYVLRKGYLLFLVFLCDIRYALIRN